MWGLFDMCLAGGFVYSGFTQQPCTWWEFGSLWFFVTKKEKKRKATYVFFFYFLKVLSTWMTKQVTFFVSRIYRKSRFRFCLQFWQSFKCRFLRHKQLWNKRKRKILHWGSNYSSLKQGGQNMRERWNQWRRFGRSRWHLCKWVCTFIHKFNYKRCYINHKCYWS